VGAADKGGLLGDVTAQAEKGGAHVFAAEHVKEQVVLVVAVVAIGVAGAGKSSKVR
jgi:hypothetical protein